MARNRLDQETSPYLLQHKDNPVHWQPWDEAALDQARQESKPILLSVGYAACHWCHVMAHESFEDADTAALMNELFVNIKVDREERPDLDTIYQSALALLGQQGGWPLTMFLTPDTEPFWGGTYFPPVAQYGRPGFRDVLKGIADIYQSEPEKVTQNVTALRDALQTLARPQGAAGISLDVTTQIAERFLQEVDMRHGGIGGAPKFPQSSILELLWRAWKRTGDSRYRDAVTLTLTRMSQGGIYDHLGGGFARYSVDAAWLVPHFEKMLYDNAELIDLLTLVWQETRDPLYEARIRETVGWLLREMRAAPGSDGRRGFASSLDADSEGEEGKFYVWTEPEIDRLLGPDAAIFKAAYDVRAGGNWEGKTILNRTARPVLGDAEAEARLAACRATLLAARADRVRPGWDDKVLADWNGLMIAALADAATAFGEPQWLEAAAEAFAFVRDDMSVAGRLRHSWRAGQSKHPASLDDYASLGRAALALHAATGDSAYLDQSRAWVEVLDAHYWDGSGGGYFFTADDTGDVLLRTKSAADAAVPSGNGIMIGVLARLHYLTGEAAYRERADATVAAFAGEIGRNFFPLATLLNSNELLQTALQVVLIGPRDAEETRTLLDVVHGRSLPNHVLTVLAADEPLPAAHPAADKPQIDGRVTAYVCRGTTCSLPITDPAGLSQALALG
ncbi:thioredoxin domain-containing protein [Rhodospirillaceae bacterium SYSU D60014]|uniref:thioredoxin domain-containing protein n=1 Tax=Virgifigura deserti TaxID=2268457 RepID=UPI000E664462